MEIIPNDENIKRKNIIKIILLGNTETGKTSLINAYDGKPFCEALLSTIGSQYFRKEKIINENKYFIQIWDTAGQEKYRSVNKIYIKGSKIVIFVYDVTNENSFFDLKSFWVDYAEKIVGKRVIMGIVGNKIDLLENIQVDTEKGKEYANGIGAAFLETSAKEFPTGIIDFINKLVKDYIDNYGEDLENEASEDSFNINKSHLSKASRKDNKDRSFCC